MSFGRIVLWPMVLGPVAYWILGRPDFGEAVMSAFPFFIGAVMLVVGKLSKASDKQMQELCQRENLTITSRVGYNIMVDEKARKLTFPPYQRAYNFSDVRYTEVTWETKPTGVLPLQSGTTGRSRLPSTTSRIRSRSSISPCKNTPRRPSPNCAC